MSHQDRLKEIDRIIDEIKQMFGPNRTPVKPNPRLEQEMQVMAMIRNKGDL